MRRHLLTAALYTIITTMIFGVLYPLLVTGLSHVFFADKANGQLLYQNGQLIGSHIIGQPFSAPTYFQSRPSAAGNGYDAANSGGSNLAPTSKKLIDRITADTATATAQNPTADVPIDLVTTSASGLDPHITPAAAAFQIPRISAARHLSADTVQTLIARHTEARQLGFLGEPRVNVLELNRDLDATAPLK